MVVKLFHYWRQWIVLVVTSICAAVISWALVLVMVFSVRFFDFRQFEVVLVGVCAFLDSLFTFMFLNLLGICLFALVSISQTAAIGRLGDAIVLVVILGILAKLANDAVSHQPWLDSSNQLFAFLIWALSVLVIAKVLRRCQS